AKLVVQPDWDAPRFVIQRGAAIDFDPNQGTVSRGVGLSPWTNQAIDGDYIKAEAQAGRMGQMLYAVAVKRTGGFDFRAPTEEDREAVRRAEAELERRLPEWETAGLVPNEPYPEQSNDPRPRIYGMPTWADFFSPRQLLAMLTSLQVLSDMQQEMSSEMNQTRVYAISTFLGLALDKAADWNAILCTWHPGRHVIGHVFQRHDFAFIWSHTEMDAARNLLPWTVGQVAKACSELATLAAPAQYSLWQEEDEMTGPLSRLCITQGSATELNHIPSHSIHNITFDPPYYDNVMYAELSDFFYVWLK